MNYVIGKNAVDAIDQQAKLSRFLLTQIPVGDTYPSWDGEILVYKSEDSRNKQSKTDILGRIPVQVKGKVVERFSKRERTFPVEVDDLKNYLNEAGVMFFVVEMTDVNDVNKTKIFYAELLIKDLYTLLKDKENQQTISYTFQELPKGKLYSICQHFLYHRKEQGFKIYNLDDKQRFDKYIFTVIGRKEEDLDFYLFENGTYIYGLDKENNLKVPLSKFKADVKIEEVEFNIGTIDKVYFDRIYREKSKNDLKVKFGKSFSIVVKNKDKIDINFKESGSIEERIKDCEFFREITKNKRIYFNNSELKIDCIDKSAQGILDGIENHIRVLKDIQKVFTYLGVNPKEDFDELKLYSKQIHFLLDVFINENINADKLTDKQFQYVNVGKYKFLLCRGKNNKFFNFFDYDVLINNFRIVVSTDKSYENSIEHSPYILLEPKILFEVDNLNLESIEKSLKSVDYTNLTALDVSNKFLLSALDYLDNSNNRKNKAILKFISNVYEYMYEKTNDIIYFINQMQAIYRMRKFVEEEIYKIIELKELYKEDDIIICAFDILLENDYEFYFKFNKFSDEQRKYITDYPIYNLLKNRNKMSD